jgi:hypothetical protein
MFLPSKNLELTNKLLENIGVVLDITEAQYDMVVGRYNAVAEQLSKDNSSLSIYQPDILPQGSFLLGTMIRPIVEDDELDVDLVCRLRGKGFYWTQERLKQAVKDQLTENKDYERMLDEEGNRCWTLIYESQRFHLDILPSTVNANNINFRETTFSQLNEQEVESISIRITDKRLANFKTESNALNWPKSNPFGYAAWFKEKANLTLTNKVFLNESIEPLPKYKKNKEPLVRAVQILKRHRDIMFGGDEHKPISIILTTLSALSYNKEDNIFDAIISILENMDSHIKRKYCPTHDREICWISNPVENTENFADKWSLNIEKEERFFDWLKKAKYDFNAIKDVDISTAYRYLKNIIGTRAVNESVKSLGFNNLLTEQYNPVNYSLGLLSVSHREKPFWPISLQYECDIYGHYRDSDDGNKRKTITGQSDVPKYCTVFFTASTNVPKPFEVYWQVVNTGEEAKRHGALRGGINKAKNLGKGGLVEKDYTAFTGLHWIECFIVKNNVCVARSSEFFVNVI